MYYFLYIGVAQNVAVDMLREALYVYRDDGFKQHNWDEY